MEIGLKNEQLNINAQKTEEIGDLNKELDWQRRCLEDEKKKVKDRDAEIMRLEQEIIDLKKQINSHKE